MAISIVYESCIMGSPSEINQARGCSKQISQPSGKQISKQGANNVIRVNKQRKRDEGRMVKRDKAWVNRIIRLSSNLSCASHVISHVIDHVNDQVGSHVMGCHPKMTSL